MATHRAVLGVLQALKDRLDLRLPALAGGNPKALILGSQALATAPAGENLGIYLHRIAVDPFARNRYLAPAENRRQRRPELPVNLHVLLIGWSTKNDSEVGYLAVAMQIIGVLSAMLRELPAPCWYLGRPVRTVREACRCSPSLPATAPELAEAATALAQWRSTRRRSSRIPEALWSQATELAERYGIAPVAVALKLDYKSLKHRLTARNAGEDARSARVIEFRRTRSRPAAGATRLRPGSQRPVGPRAAHRTAASGQ